MIEEALDRTIGADYPVAIGDWNATVEEDAVGKYVGKYCL